MLFPHEFTVNASVKYTVDVGRIGIIVTGFCEGCIVAHNRCTEIFKYWMKWTGLIENQRVKHLFQIYDSFSKTGPYIEFTFVEV